MTDFIVKRASKLLFPHLARDQRKQLLLIIMLVAVTCLFTTALLLAGMLYARR